MPTAQDVIAKTQQVRALDVLLLGPFMVWAAWQPGSLPPWARFALAGSGVLAVTYNALRMAEQAAGRPPVPAWVMGAQPALALGLAALAGTIAVRAGGARR